MQQELGKLQRRIPADVFQEYVIDANKPSSYDSGRPSTMKNILYGIGGAGAGAALGSAILPFGGTMVGSLLGGYLGSQLGEDTGQEDRIAQAKFNTMQARLDAAKDIYNTKYRNPLQSLDPDFDSKVKL